MILRLSSALICLLFAVSTASAQCSSCSQGSAPVFSQGVAAPVYSSTVHSHSILGIVSAPLRVRTNNACCPTNCGCPQQNSCAAQPCCVAQNSGCCSNQVARRWTVARRNDCCTAQTACMSGSMVAMSACGSCADCAQSAPVMQETHTAAPVEAAPVQDAPVQDAPVQDAPVEPAPVADHSAATVVDAPVAVETACSSCNSCAQTVQCCNNTRGFRVRNNNCNTCNTCNTCQPVVANYGCASDCGGYAPATRRVSIFGSRRGARCCN